MTKFHSNDGVLNRTHFRELEWNRSIFVGVLCSVLLLVALIVIGILFFNDSLWERRLNVNKSPVCQEITIDRFQNFSKQQLNDTLISPNHKYYFHPGRLTFSQAQRVCAGLPGGGGNLTTILSEQQEINFDSQIEKHGDTLFVNDSKTELLAGFRNQIWTGGYVDLELDGVNRIRWIDDTHRSELRMNFCEERQSMEMLKISFDRFKKYGLSANMPNPLVYIVKDYRQNKDARKNGCWQIYSPCLYQTEHLEFSFVCQVSAAGVPFMFELNFLGKATWANVYAAFSGRGTFAIARETCQHLGSDVEMLSPKTLDLDKEINHGIMDHFMKIFGVDNGDPRRRELIWTGGYYNLSSKYPTRIRWVDDHNRRLDIKEIATTEPDIGSKGNENFCAPFGYDHGLIEQALEEERVLEDGCVKERLFIIAKDFRKEQGNKGCWAVYDLDYLERNDYKLYLVCKRPHQVLRTK